MRATSGKSGAQVLRERLKKPEILVAPGAYAVSYTHLTLPTN